MQSAGSAARMPQLPWESRGQRRSPFAQREAGFQAWLNGESPYIVATAALGTGIDVPGITHVIHLEAPHSIIDYAQEAGRAGMSGERVVAMVVIEDKDWPEEIAAKDSCLELKRRKVSGLIRTKGVGVVSVGGA